MEVTCKKCDKPMMYVRRFDGDEQTCFYRCPVCGYETAHKPLTFNDKPSGKKRNRHKNKKKNDART